MISPLTYQASQARIEDLHRRSAEGQSLPRERKATVRARLSTLLTRRPAIARPTFQTTERPVPSR
jgi:hypothetical protein